MRGFAPIITCRTSKGEQRTTATVYGSWAVHQSLDVGDRAWVITQVHTGLAVPREHTVLLTKAQAIEAARRLDEQIGPRQRPHRAIGKRIVGIILDVLCGRP